MEITLQRKLNIVNKQKKYRYEMEITYESRAYGIFFNERAQA
jgi:hypothetical protein